jgi:hypothetical protein
VRRFICYFCWFGLTSLFPTSELPFVIEVLPWGPPPPTRKEIHPCIRFLPRFTAPWMAWPSWLVVVTPQMPNRRCAWLFPGVREAIPIELQAGRRVYFIHHPCQGNVRETVGGITSADRTMDARKPHLFQLRVFVPVSLYRPERRLKCRAQLVERQSLFSIPNGPCTLERRSPLSQTQTSR